MKDLNLKKLARDMTFLEKAKLFFADNDLRYVTKGKERLLTPEEKREIIRDCEEKGQIGTLNRLIKLYNFETFAIVDVRMSTQKLQDFIRRINLFTLLIRQQYCVTEVFNSLMEASSAKSMRKFRGLLEEKKKYILRFSEYELLNSPDDKKALPCATDKEPNLIIQALFLAAVRSIKRLKTDMYIVDHICKKAEIDLLNAREKGTMAEAEETIKEFEELDGPLKILKLYHSFYDKELMRRKDFTEQGFLQILLDHKAAVTLSEEDRISAEKEVEHLLECAEL